MKTLKPKTQKPEKLKLTALDIEIAVSKFFNFRTHLIIPNVWWGLHLPYEADLVVLSDSGYATEIEIKVANSDIKADKNKRFQHDSNMFKKFYYAVPDYLQHSEHLPTDCGLIIVDKNLNCKIVRPSKNNKYARKLQPSEILKLASLGCMRIWNLKTHLQKVKNQLKQK